MKIKYISTLLFILIFAGVALLVSTPAQAGDWDRECDDSTTAGGTCAIFSSPDGPVWAMKAFVGFDKDGIEIPANLNNWPLCDTANNALVFQYIAGPVVPEKGKVRAAVSYLVFDWFDWPLEGSFPDGAAIDISQFSKLFEGCDPNPEDLAYKSNASVNNKTDAIITFIEPLGTQVNTSGQAWMKWANDCDTHNIWTAKASASGEGPLTEPQVLTYTNCAGTNVVVTKNVCGRIESVTCNGDPATFVPDAQFCESNIQTQNDCFEIEPNTSGSMICTTPPVFTFGTNMWFCPETE